MDHGEKASGGVVGEGGIANGQRVIDQQQRQPDNLGPFALEIGRTGTLRAALASLDCRLVSALVAGDHTLFIGEVIEAYVRSTDRPLTSQELLYVYLGGKVLFDQMSRKPLRLE